MPLDRATAVLALVTSPPTALRARAGRSAGALALALLLAACNSGGKRAQDPLAVYVAGGGTGSGRVESGPAGIDCVIAAGAAAPTGCSAVFAPGTTVTLDASASAGSSFSGWTGGCSGAGPCVIALAATTSVTATFTLSPAIALSPTAVAFQATQGGANPAAQSVQVTETSGGALSGLAVGAIVYGAGATGWLSSLLSATTAPTTLSLQATTAGLAAGSYTASVPVTAAAASNSPQTVTVSLVVAAPATAQLTIAGSGSGSGTVTSTPAGINCAITAGAPAATGCGATFAQGTAITLAASASAGSSFSGWSGGCAGSAGCSLTLAQATSVSAAFALVPPSIALAPGAVAFQAIAGGPNPAAQSVQVTSSGGALSDLAVGAIAYGAGASGWLSSQLAATSAPTTLSLQATVGSLAAGSYTASVPITSAAAANSPQTVTVTLVISSATPSIALAPGALAFQATQGAASPAAQSVSVTNGGGGTLSSLAVGTVTYGVGANGWLSSPLAGTTAPTTLSVQATTGGLAAGSYTASVPITAGAASNSPQTLQVTLTVSPQPTFAISGTITGTPAVGAAVALTGAASAGTTVDSGGHYSFNGLSNGSYTVTPSLAGTAFTPASRPATVSGADVSGIDFTASVAAPRTSTVCNANQWCWDFPLPQGQPIYAVWGAAASDVWAVGQSGTILHWDGTAWTLSRAGGTVTGSSNLFALWGSGPGDVWAVGDQSAVHWNGSAWAAVPLYQPLSLRDVWGSGPSDVYAAGTRGFVHWDGSAWTPVAGLPAGLLSFSAVWGSGAADVWVAASDGINNFLLHGGGATWSQQPTPSNAALASLWGTGTNDVWASGGGGSTPVILHWNGSAWSAVPVPTDSQLSSVWGSGAADVWATGAVGTVLHWDGASWTAVPSHTGGNLSGVWASSPTDAWAVDANPGNIHHWGGFAWSTETSLGARPAGIFGTSAQDLWAFSFDSGIFSRHAQATSAHSISGGIAGAAGGAVTVTLSGAASASLVTDATGSFRFAGLADGSYTLTPSRADLTFTPPSRTVALAGQDLRAQSFTSTGPSHGVCTADHWCWESPQPEGAFLSATWASAANDAWVVGAAGTALHWDGATWTRPPSGTHQDLASVWGSASGHVWAVGPAGVIIHWNGTRWSVYPSGTQNNLAGVWASGPADAWAVGDSGTLLHWNGSAWSLATSNTGNNLYAVWGSAAGDVWASGAGTLLHLVSGSWGTVTYPGDDFTSIWGSGPADLYAAGNSGVYHSSGSAWTISRPRANQNSTPYAVFGTSASDVWAAGRGGTLAHWNGSTWTAVASGVTVDLLAGRATAAGAALAVGGSNGAVGSGTITGWNGTAWAPLSTGLGVDDNVTGLWGSSVTDVWAAGPVGRLLHSDGTVWSAVTAGLSPTKALTALWGSTSGNVWAVGSFQIARWNGSAWSTAPWTTSSTPYLVDIFGTGANDLWSVGSSGGAQYSGSTWNNVAQVQGAAIWGSAPNDYWAAPPAAHTLQHWDGTAWSTFNVNVSSTYFGGISGTSAADVWVVGDRIVHFGGPWAATVFNTWLSNSGLASVWARAPDDAFAVGSNGLVLHWNGIEWSPMDSGTKLQLNKVWGTSATDVWIGGQGGTILRYRP